MHRPLAPRRAARRQRGFTLLEMILATALSLALLGGLWQLFSTYADLFEQGQQQVEESQLLRSVMQLFTEDLGSAIQDPIFQDPTVTAGSAPQRRFGLSGTADELRVDVLKLTPQRGNPDPVGANAGGSPPTNLARVPELPAPAYDDARWAILEHLLALLPVAAASLEVEFAARGESDYVGVARAALDAMETFRQKALSFGRLAALFRFEQREFFQKRSDDVANVPLVDIGSLE